MHGIRKVCLSCCFWLSLITSPIRQETVNISLTAIVLLQAGASKSCSTYRYNLGRTDVDMNNDYLINALSKTAYCLYPLGQTDTEFGFHIDYLSKLQLGMYISIIL